MYGVSGDGKKVISVDSFPYITVVCWQPPPTMSHGTLYSFSESGNSYKVRLLSTLLKLDIKIVELDFLISQHMCLRPL
jgi:hypothetical protein